MSDKRYSYRSDKIALSGIRKMSEKIKPDTINLTLGEPDFNPPKHIRTAMLKATEEGHNKYTPPLGVRELRDSIAIRLSKYSPNIKGDNVLVTIGGSEALFLSALIFYDPMDEILVPDPGFTVYLSHISLCRGKPVFYRCAEKHKFVPDLADMENLITDKTKAILVNSPNNPTGAVYDEKTVDGIVELAEKHDLMIISDEVYDEIIYTDHHVSFLGRSDRVVYINSFSKTYAATGWRLGYLVADPTTIQKMVGLHHAIVACPPSITQYAAIDALLAEQTEVRSMVEKYKARRDFLIAALNKTEGFKCFMPGGAFYAFPSFDFKMDSMDLAMRLLDGGVGTVPGVAFGSCGEGYLRLSYATSMQNLREAIKRIRVVATALANEERADGRRSQSSMSYYHDEDEKKDIAKSNGSEE